MRTFVRIPDQQTIQARKLLGQGGQGEVWLAELAGKQIAVKIYHRHTASAAQRAVIERLVEKGPPAKYFLWPTALVEEPAAGTYGYVMELREGRFHSLDDFMARRIAPSFRALLTASRQLADGFLRLHSRGLCYRDISFGNVFFDPTTGDVRICDNDNVDISGTKSGSVLGTPRFMAPEVVRREAVPTAETDRYSLAVLLFYLLMGGHPLDGAREAAIRCLDVPAMEKLYGFEPLYIFDPSDSSNRPKPGIHDNPGIFHPLYPPQLRALFLRSFTDGLHYPAKRVRESEWRNAFARAIDGILLCDTCHSENLHDPDAPGAQGAGACWSCHQALTLSLRILIDGNLVILTRETRLYGHHIGLAPDDESPIAEIARNPSNPNLFGLRNLTAKTWTLTRPDGSMVDVPPDRSAPVLPGNKINFGPATGEIRA